MTEKRIHKIKCSGCCEKKFVNPKALETRLAKYGSIEKIEAEWKCRQCRKLTEGVPDEMPATQFPEDNIEE